MRQIPRQGDHPERTNENASLSRLIAAEIDDKYMEMYAFPRKVGNFCMITILSLMIAQVNHVMAALYGAGARNSFAYILTPHIEMILATIVAGSASSMAFLACIPWLLSTIQDIVGFDSTLSGKWEALENDRLKLLVDDCGEIVRLVRRLVSDLIVSKVTIILANVKRIGVSKYPTTVAASSRSGTHRSRCLHP